MDFDEQSFFVALKNTKYVLESVKFQKWLASADSNMIRVATEDLEPNKFLGWHHLRQCIPAAKAALKAGINVALSS